MYQMIGIDPSLAANAVPQFTPGTHGKDDDGKIYKYMLYDAGTAAAAGVAGEVAYYVADTGFAAHTVTSDLTDSSENGAGVLQVAMADATYGWFQIKGQAILSIALAAGGDGDPLTPTGATDGTLDLTTAVTDHICGFAIDATAKEIYCDFPW